MEAFGYLSLVPAVVTILVALLLRKVALALFLGVVAGAFVLAEYNVLSFLSEVWHYMVISFTDIERLKIVLFILLIGGMLKMIEKRGAYDCFAHKLSAHINTPRKSRLSTWLVSFLLFFDDYANVLISGSSMKNINVKNKVSLAFLAYKVDVLATMASVMLISTWASYEGSVMLDSGEDLGMDKSMTTFFLDSIPYHFYTFLAIALTLLVAYTGKWFGYKIDKQNFVGRINGAEEIHDRLRSYHVLAPVLSLLGLAIVGLFVIGTFFLVQEEKAITLINILGAAPTIDILVGATIIALIVAYVLFKKDRLIRPLIAFRNIAQGTKEMLEVALVIIFATGLSAVSETLGTGDYISNSIITYIRPELIPALIFLISMLVTVATGFSWSSMAIVMPIAYQLCAGFEVMYFIPVVSAAVITGAVSGEHVIPFSEKAIMSSTACGIPSVYHVKTMSFQTITVIVAAFVGFLLLGYGWPLYVAYLIPLTFIIVLHFVFAGKIKPEAYRL